MDYIKNYTIGELKEKISTLGFPKYRAEQVAKYIYSNYTNSFESIAIIPKDLRQVLSENFILDSIQNYNIRKSEDGTIKFLFELKRGGNIETVAIPSHNAKGRTTLCISTQIGCPINCKFCATGKLGFKDNLFAAEIIDQFIFAQKNIDAKITNIVFMGMGEPLLNTENLIKSIRIFTENELISAKKITISTVGIVPEILKLADSGIRTKLAVSLHATNDRIRESIIPIAKKWNLSSLLKSIEYYYQKTKSAITFEYILFNKLNDTQEDAKKLAAFSRRFPVRINLIPFNDISFIAPKNRQELIPSPKDRIFVFADWLKTENCFAFIRKSTGKDIEAACGQLAYSKETE